MEGSTSYVLNVVFTKFFQFILLHSYFGYAFSPLTAAGSPLFFFSGQIDIAATLASPSRQPHSMNSISIHQFSQTLPLFTIKRTWAISRILVERGWEKRARKTSERRSPSIERLCRWDERRDKETGLAFQIQIPLIPLNDRILTETEPFHPVQPGSPPMCRVRIVRSFS